MDISEMKNVDSIFSNPIASSKLLMFSSILRKHNSVEPNSVVIAGGTVVKVVSGPWNNDEDQSQDIEDQSQDIEDQSQDIEDQSQDIEGKDIEDQSQDIDLYVNMYKASDVLNDVMVTLKRNGGNVRTEITVTPIYDESFLRKNNIILIVDMTIKQIHVQVMITKVSVMDVITNFDLTCCQCWFDGYSIKGTHLQQTIDMQCQLQGEYVGSLLSGNEYTSSRVNKYASRGFNITFDTGFYAGTVSTVEVHKYLRPYVGTDWVEVIVKLMMGRLSPSFNQIFAMATQGYTVDNFLKIFNIRDSYTNPFKDNGERDAYINSHPLRYNGLFIVCIRNLERMDHPVPEVMKVLVLSRYTEGEFDDLSEKEEASFIHHVPSTHKPVVVPMNFDVNVSLN